MAAENGLRVGRQYKFREFMCGRRRAVDDSQAVIGADCEFIGQRDDHLTGILFLRFDRVGGVGQENIGAAFGDMPAIDIAAGRRLGAVGGPVSMSALASSAALAPGIRASALANTAKA